MSTFTHELNGEILDHENVSGGVSTVFTSTPTEFEYFSVDGHRITITGTFTYDSGVEPNSGSIDRIEIDLGNTGTSDIVIDYGLAQILTPNFFSGIPDTFWATVSKPVEAHNLLAQTTNPSTYSADGDDLEAGAGTVNASDDLINISGRYEVSGDYDTLASTSGVTLNGGEDSFTVNASSTTGQITMIGDVDTAGDGSTVNCGDDTFRDISRNELASNIVIVGDVDSVRNAELNGGNDVITGGKTELVIYGDARSVAEGATVEGGDDLITGSSVDDLIYGDVSLIFADMDAAPLSTTLIAGNDTIDGGAGDDAIYGDLGGTSQSGSTLILFTSGGDDIISGGAGEDFINGNFGNDIINGGDDDDTLVGESGNDQIYGDAGNDLIIATLGNDAIDGGAGFDTVDYTNNARMIVNLDSMTRDGVAQRLATDTVSGELDTLRFIENVVAGDGFDRLWGSATRNRLEGGDGDDYLRGRGGNDTLVGGTGDDDLIGDSGADTADYSNDVGSVLIDLGNGNAFDGSGGFDFLSSIEWIIGSAFTDELYGDSSNNRFYGGNGDDTLDGRDGNDLLFGEVGDDSLNGGNGNDRLYGGDGMDGLQGGAGVDILDGGAGDDVLLGGDGGDRLFGRDGVDHLIGGDGIDVLTAGFDDDILEGGNDRDFLRGNEGDDRLIGGDGDDRIDGGEGDNDTAVFTGDLSDYLITINNGVVVVEDNNLTNGDDGRDVLTTVEFLEFADGIVDVAGL